MRNFLAQEEICDLFRANLFLLLWLYPYLFYMANIPSSIYPHLHKITLDITAVPAWVNLYFWYLWLSSLLKQLKNTKKNDKYKNGIFLKYCFKVLFQNTNASQFENNFYILQLLVD